MLLRSIGAATLVLVLAGCGGGSTLAPLEPVTPGNASPAQYGRFVYDAAYVRASHYVGRATFGTGSFDLALPMRDALGLRAFAASVSDRTSANYRHFLTPNQIADRFAATSADQTKAVAYLKAAGVRVRTWRQRLLVEASGTQANLEAALHTTFGNYVDARGNRFIAPTTQPSVATGVPIVGSPNVVSHPKRAVRQFMPSLGGGAGYAPQQLAKAFDFNGAYAAGYTGAGVRVGVIGTGPIATSTAGRLGDVEAYKALFHVGGASTVSLVATSSSDPVVNSASGFSPPPPVTGPCSIAGQLAPPSEEPSPTCNPEDIETQIDTEQIASLARDASVEYYLAYNPNDQCGGTIGQPCPPGAGLPLQGLAETDEEVQTAIDHDSADVLSLSYGYPEFGQVATGTTTSPPAEFTADGRGLDPTEFAMLASEGIAVFVASGDQGAEACQQDPALTKNLDSKCVSYPASDPNVTAVGGVTVPLSTSGSLVGPITAWGLSTNGGAGGTGGGVSAYFPQPTYQSGIAGVIGTTRNVPDAALTGDPSTGVAVLTYADSSFGARNVESVGGTSVAAPEMAAMWALVLQACKANAACAGGGSGPYPYRLGSASPALYAIARTPATYAQTILSVGYGNNSLATYCYYNGATDPTNCPGGQPGGGAAPPTIDPGYVANPAGGYNQLTGLGVPFARALIKSVVGV